MGFFDWIRKTKNTKTTVKVAVQKPEREQKTWKCACGRKNIDYVSTCSCGTNKRELGFSTAQQLDQTNVANNAEEKHDQETKKNQWTSQEDHQTTKISITSKGKNTIRQYMGCDVYEDQVFEAVTVAGAKIIGIGMTEVHDWDDRDWYSAGFDSYEAYLQDAEHNKYICEWIADAKYGGVSITFSKPYNMVRNGLFFRYDGTDEAHLADFFETFDNHCCKKKTVMDRRDPTQKQASSHSTPKQKKAIEPKAVRYTAVEETQDTDPVNCKVADDSPKQRQSAAVNKIQSKVFILHTAKNDKELALIQSELSGLIEREYGVKIFPYMYDVDILGDFSNSNSDTVHYFFSLNGFELQLDYCFDRNIIMLTNKGADEDPFGNQLADRLKQHIYKVLTQRTSLEETQTADDIGNPSTETGGNDPTCATTRSDIEEALLPIVSTTERTNKKNDPNISIQEKQSETPETIHRKAHYCHCCWDRITEEEAQAYNNSCKLCAVPPNIKHEQAIPVDRFKKMIQAYGRELAPGLGSIYYFGLDKENGNAWMVDKRAVGEEYYGTIISYEYLIAQSDESSRGKRIKKLTSANWYEYLLIPVGDFISLGRGESPSGPYGSSAHYGLKVLENGYLVEWAFGSPMAGMYQDSWELPNGFFANKSKEQIVAYFKEHGGFLSEDCVGIDEEDLEDLIRTDCWRMNRRQTPSPQDTAVQNADRPMI